MLFHYFDRFLSEYESRFEKEYGFLRPVIKEVVERYLDWGNPRCGFARIRCPSCGEERLLMFSCRSRGFCPSCHAKRLEEWGEWMRETLLLNVPHRQVVFTIPRMLRIFFKYNRRVLGDLCQAACEALLKYFQAVFGKELRPGAVASIQTFGQKINLHPHLLVTEGGEDSEGRFHHLASFQDSLLAEFFKREVFALLLGEELISEAVVEKISGWRHSDFSVHSKVRAKTRKEAERVGKSKEGVNKFIIIEEERPRIPRRGWAEMIRKVYEVDPLLCPQCGGRMRIIAFLTDYAVVDRIIHHLKLSFVAAKPPPPHIAYQEFLMAAEAGGEYLS